MKITLTGSLGHIGKPLTQKLVEKGHSITVISSNPERQKEIEAIGAKAAIGSIEDTAFLTSTFTGADAVYCMIPPNYEGEPDIIKYYERIGTNYAEAIRKSGIRRVVDLSSFGAHHAEGTGIIVGAHRVENILNEIPNILLTHVRPTSFYYNLYEFIGSIKATGRIMANCGEEKIPMVSTKDIAGAIAEELEKNKSAKKVRYVGSDERTGQEIARVVGKAIGKQNLQWELISDEEMEEALKQGGLGEEMASKLTEMHAAIRNGKMTEDYKKHKPDLIGKIKLEDFAKEFAAAFEKT
jgi:uncharacterized protein YbjT (DUF2867 family)